jgi:hypothetical protein
MNNPVSSVDPVGLEAYSNVETGVTVRKTLKGWIILFEYEGGTYTLIIHDENNWTLLDPNRNPIIILQHGKINGIFGAGFYTGFISYCRFQNSEPELQHYEGTLYEQAKNYAEDWLGLTEEEALCWALGYVLGTLAAITFLNKYPSAYMMQLAPSCLNDMGWHEMCKEIFEWMLTGYPLPWPVKVPIYVELLEWAYEIWDYFKKNLLD